MHGTKQIWRKCLSALRCQSHQIVPEYFRFTPSLPTTAERPAPAGFQRRGVAAANNKNNPVQYSLVVHPALAAVPRNDVTKAHHFPGSERGEIACRFFSWWTSAKKSSKMEANQLILALMASVYLHTWATKGVPHKKPLDKRARMK